MFSATLFGLAVYLVEEANQFVPYDEPLDQQSLAWGGATFVASLVAGIIAVTLRVLQPKTPVLVPTKDDVAGGIAPAVRLVVLARGFVLRLHQVLLVTGVLLLSGGIGLIATASLIADGTPVGPFESLPGKVWVVHFHFWQVQVSAWGFVLLAIALTLWAPEYAWARRLRVAWSEGAPEV